MRDKKKTYEGSSQSLKLFGNLDSQMVLDERPLTPNGARNNREIDIEKVKMLGQQAQKLGSMVESTTKKIKKIENPTN